jgi:hypothetical protein
MGMQRRRLRDTRGRFAWVTYIESPHDPRAGSYKPPRTGFSRVSKVVSFSIFLTDTA